MCDRTVWEAQARETVDFLEFQGTAAVWDAESSHLDELFVSYIEDRRKGGRPSNVSPQILREPDPAVG